MIQEPAYYATIPAPVRYDKTLPAAAKLLYGEITALCTAKGYCWAGNGHFAELYDVTKDTVSVWISKLNKLGYVRVEIDKDAGNMRRIYLSEKTQIPIEKNLDRYPEKDREVSRKKGIAIAKNREQNITENNTESITTNTLTTPTPFVDADAPTVGQDELTVEVDAQPQEPTSTPDQKNNPAPGAATNALVVNNGDKLEGNKPARTRKAESDYAIGHKIHLMLEQRTPGIPWGAKEGAAAKQIGERMLNTLKKNGQPHDDDDVLQFLATVIELTYQLPPFYHFTSITALNAKYPDIYQQLVDRKKRGNLSATPSNASTRPVRQTDAEFAADIDRFAEMRYGRAGA